MRYAKIENGRVDIVVDVPETETERGAEYLSVDLGLGGIWIPDPDCVASPGVEFDGTDFVFEVITAININTAAIEELQSLLGIGPVRAQAIIDGRPWSDTGDLSSIEGISTEMLSGWNISV